MRISHLVFFSLLFSTVNAVQGDVSIMVRSVYRGERVDTWGNPIDWRVEKNGPLLTLTQVGKEASPRVCVVLDGGGRVNEITKTMDIGGKTATTRETVDQSMVLSEDFPVPFDYLGPLNSDFTEAAVRKKAGGLTFTKRVVRSIRSMTAKEAAAEGMLDLASDVQYGSDPLFLISVSGKDDPGFWVRQLWPGKGDWWLYEETPQRRSWQVGAGLPNSK